MKNILTLITIILIAFNANAQLISRFTWESSPVTTAAAGANALSVSSFATSSNYGTNGTKGLNPGNGSNDINLVLDGANFNVPALDIAVDFRREESQASFFYRGSNFNFGMSGGSLSASFQLTSGASYITVNTGNIATIADDHSFHNYHFNYENNTGTAKIWVDNVLMYTYNGTAGVPMYWTGAGNVTIGREMDATGRNVAVLDNMIIQIHANALLPLTLVSFAAELKNNLPLLNWKTTEEISVSAFVLERSADGASFTAITTVPASNKYNGISDYRFTDSSFNGAVTYYRLKMVNDNGTYSYSAVKSVAVASSLNARVTVYPNPTADIVTIKMNNAKAGQYQYTVTSITGMVVTSATVQLGNGINLVKIDLTRTTVKGALIIHMGNTQNNIAETFTVIKK